MLFTKSVGAVVFYKSPEGQIEYLLLNHGKSRKKSDIEYWNFPKGTMEKGETEIQTARREIEEETGLVNLKFVPKFREAERYFCRGTKQSNKGKLIFKTVILFLAEAKNRDIKISNEHVGWEWLDSVTAIHRLNFKSGRKIMRKADKFLHNKISK